MNQSTSFEWIKSNVLSLFYAVLIAIIIRTEILKKNKNVWII